MRQLEPTRQTYQVPFSNIEQQQSVLKEILQVQAPYSISLYMPGQVAGSEMQPGQVVDIQMRQNPIRFRNLIRQADAQLAMANLDNRARESILKPLVELHQEFGFWQELRQGLAVFLTEDRLQIFHLPSAVEELVVVSERPHLMPLLPILSQTKTFHLLVLHQREPSFYHGNAFYLSPIELPEDIRSIESLNEEFIPSQQFHTGMKRGTVNTGMSRATTPTVSKAQPNYHGQGSIKDFKKDEILRYFRKLDKALREHLDKHDTPLMLAGVTYLHNIYRKANTYSQLLQQGIEADPDNWDQATLHQQAWSLFSSLEEQEKEDVTHQFLQSVNHGKASHRLREVVPAAHYGRVSHLFVAQDKHAWGQFTPQEDRMNVTLQSRPDNEDLLNLAAMQTLMHGGKVYIVDSNTMPQGSHCAALFRF